MVVVAAFTVASCAGCMVGPNYHKPAVQTPAAFRTLAPDAQAQAQVSSYGDLPWWEAFHDPRLQELIRTGLKQNYDLRLPADRINSARAQLVVTRSNWLPQL